MAGITTVEEANEFLIKYIDKFNEKYAVEPENTETAFRNLPVAMDIDNILCVKVNRSIDNGSVFSYANKHFKVICEDIPPRARVDVLISTRFGIRAMYKDKAFVVIPYARPKRKQKVPAKARKTYTPPDDHYFKYGHELWTKLSYAESTDELMEMLEHIFLKKYA